MFFSFTFGTTAPTSKERKPDDATLKSQGPPTAPANATIWNDMLEPAIQYIRNRLQFGDWDCPQQLKVRDDTVDEVGGFMAPFNNKQNCIEALHTSSRHISAVPYTLSRPQILSNTRGCLEPSSNRCRNQRRELDSGRLPHAKSCSSNWGDRLRILSSAVAKRNPSPKCATLCEDTNLARCLKMTRGHSEDF